jgi:hypothetical protein
LLNETGIEISILLWANFLLLLNFRFSVGSTKGTFST